MTAPSSTGLLSAVEAWVRADADVSAAVLYGSGARRAEEQLGSDDWSDVDLHVITGAPARLGARSWTQLLAGQRFCFQVGRSATGGTNKITLLCESGQVDIIVLRRGAMQLARIAMRLGLHRHMRLIRTGLDEMATSMRSGYRFLKGADAWTEFYARVVREMPGIRLGDDAASHLADSFLVTLQLAFKRLERGELMAVQFVLHGVLAETNFRLIRELRLRQHQSLPSFGLARRAETLFSLEELSWVRLSARLDREELMRALWTAFAGLKALMNKLVPDWRVPATYPKLVAGYRQSSDS